MDEQKSGNDDFDEYLEMLDISKGKWCTKRCFCFCSVAKYWNLLKSIENIFLEISNDLDEQNSDDDIAEYLEMLDIYKGECNDDFDGELFSGVDLMDESNDSSY